MENKKVINKWPNFKNSWPKALFPSLRLNNKPTLFPDAHESMGN